MLTPTGLANVSPFKLMSLLSSLRSFQDLRRFPEWQPLKPPTGAGWRSSTVGADMVYSRIVQLVDLEVSVGSWVKQALVALPESERSTAQAYVHRNARDELKHDTAFRHFRTYIGGSPQSAEAQALVAEWQAQEPSFALAYALEMGVFMSLLPFLNRHGDTYVAQLSQWVSDDEVVHVRTNLALAQACGQKLTRTHFSLVARTVAWVFETEENTSQLVERALKRLTTGKDPAMLEQSLPTTIKFFEQSSTTTISYK
jgi:hypothetical protein